MLDVKHLTKVFPGGTTALHDVSLQVKRGEFLALLGPSGGGKSTLFQCIIRLISPTSGRIYFDGTDLLSLKGVQLARTRRKIGMVFQQYNLVQRLSALENVLAGRLPHLPTWRAITRTFPKEDIALAMDCLDRVGLLPLAHQRADTLSGGQQQRVAIARALAQHPSLLLADEPVSSLDPESAKQVMDVLRFINEEEGITVICSLHQLSLATEYAPRIVGLNRGRIILDQQGGSLSQEQRNMIYGQLKAG